MAAITKVKDKNDKIIRYRYQVRKKSYPNQIANYLTLALARAWGKKIENEIYAGKVSSGEEGKHTLAELIARYIEDTNPTKYYKYFRSHWLIAVEKAELKCDFRFHDLRHTTASYLASNNINQATIMSIMGHKSLAASQRYMHLSVDHNADVLAKVFGNG
ncbi:MAG: tyrosine-type recombinase/integrase [Gammaproteobacteria bacterium]|nr:tyrosine-type recombinase/integrase [Gammaproteobacteria bacterium]MDX2488669.1 tyrosine-type recombinase/integrase [Gammaproteobacteria bacterium]